MHCLIVDTQPGRLDLSMIAFLEAGLQVTGTGNLQVAEACLRRSLVDVLVIDKGPKGPSHARLLRLAETRNSQLVTMFLTPTVERDSEPVPRAYPSVHCVLGANVNPNLVAKLALASLAEKTVCSGLDAEPFLTRVQFDTETGDKAPLFQSARANADRFAA
ncbi:MAG: hypothetical protein ACRBB0_12395 [Pelagimonas sp.]|uniref:hypothetical protein n=1 Tax=Pelagimonas sp. TaxID=2073170 RepID=UPI003D6B76B4